MTKFPYKYPSPYPDDTWFTEDNYREWEEENYPRLSIQRHGIAVDRRLKELWGYSPWDNIVPRGTDSEEQRTGDELV